MNKEAVMQLGIEKIAEEKEKKKIKDEAKKNHLKRSLLTNIPLMGLSGAGFGAGYAKNPNKGMAIGGLAGAGLGAATSYLGSKAKQKRLEKGIGLFTDKQIDKMNKKYTDKNKNQGIAKDVASGLIGGVGGYYAGKNYGKLGNFARQTKEFTDAFHKANDKVKEEIKRKARQKDSIDLGKDSYSIAKDFKKLTSGR